MSGLVVATANVNGIRAAMKRGFAEWVAARQPDVIALQEVRAPVEVLSELFEPDGWHVSQWPCEIKGRAGVAVLSRLPIAEVRLGVAREGEDAPPVDTGRWLEADLALPGGGTFTVVSAYLHSASNDPGKEHTLTAKYAHLDRVTERLATLVQSPAPVLVTGDVNIAHRNVDIANWRGNQKSAGFLPEERAYLDRWFDELGWADLGRVHGGEGPGPYTWWSWRGQAFVNDKGWRIDYHLANSALAPLCTSVEIDRAPSYEARTSDHAPVVATYNL